MIRVILISTSYELQEGLAKVNASHSPGRYNWETTASFAQEPAFWANVDLLILDIPADALIQSAFVEKLKAQVPHDKRLIVLAPVLHPVLLQISQAFPKVRLIKMPAEASAIYRTLVDLTTAYPQGYQQIHPRYLTDLSATIVSDVKAIRIEATIKNLSVGGAYFEIVESQPTFQDGDLVRMSIGSAGSKTYAFDAKLVWAKPVPIHNSYGYGCSFLSKDQVYETLLAQVSRGK